MMKNSPFAITVVCRETESVLNQNPASMAMFGCISSFTRDNGYSLGQERAAGSYSSDFLIALFEDSPSEYQRLKASQGYFTSRLRIVSRDILAKLGFEPDDECYHDITIASTCDPITLGRVFIVSQIDCTDIVLSQRQLELVNEELVQEKDRMMMLITRQYELIKILGERMEKEQLTSDSDLENKIRSIRETLIDSGQARSSISGSSGPESLKVVKVIGKGSYGTVFLADWRGSTVAVKRMILSSGQNSIRERMAAMEVAISQGSLLDSPTYVICPNGSWTDPPPRPQSLS